MNELLHLEQKSFKTFSIFSFFILLTLMIFLSMFSSKYTVTNINYAAFSQSGLKMIHYPKEAIVGYHAFKGCQGLSKVIYESVSGSVMRP